MQLRQAKYAVLTAAVILSLISLGAAFFFTIGSGYRTILRTTEKELRVKLESALGKVYLSRGDGKKICTVEIKESKRRKAKGKISYNIKNGVGILDLDLSKYADSEFEEIDEDHFDQSDLEGGKWYIRLTDAIPISLNLELGLGSGEFDCSGLMVKDFKLSTGASSVVLRFLEPNKSVIQNMKIESGVSRFVGKSLGNANFRRLEFSGGVGSYTLDFTGNLQDEVDVKVEVGLGAVTILVPHDIGARVQFEENWISKIDLDRDFQKMRGGQYFSDNYNTAKGRMNLIVESGLGHVKIRRTGPD